MDEFPRRTFCALLAASAGTISGDSAMSQGSPASTERQNGSGNVTVVTTRQELESQDWLGLAVDDAGICRALDPDCFLTRLSLEVDSH